MKNIWFFYLLLAVSLRAEKIPVYVGSGSEHGISTIFLDSESGALSGKSIAIKSFAPGALALSKDKKYVFSVGKDQGEKLGFVASFSRLADGRLKLVSKQSSMGEVPCHLSLDAESENLFVANYNSGSVASYKIDADGNISKPVSHHLHEGSSVHPERQTRAFAHSIYSTSDRKFVYAADLGTDKVMVYTLDAASGKLTPSSEANVPPGSGPRHMVFSNDETKVYVLNEISLSISRFGRDQQSGKLTLEITKPVMEKMGEEMTCSEIKLSKDGKFLYAAVRDIANKQRDVISILKVEDLSIIQEQATGAWVPRHFSISPCGKWMIIAGMRDNKVVVHALDPSTGKLTLTPHNVEMELPMWILFP